LTYATLSSLRPSSSAAGLKTFFNCVNNFGGFTLLHKLDALLSSITPILPHVDKASAPMLGLRA
jgi:hypothetical protein